MILTPDQRLRVFVSSTLEELASEREAVQRAIESLRLTPVMFELGARPHPPSSLYRSYLEQSHVFVAVYAERYGWVAPEMTISGLEDEFSRAARLPRLVYVREPAPKREPRLQELIERIEREGAVSYKRFSNAEELEQLVREDLVTLLTERFAARSPADRAPVPAPAAPLVGRTAELEELGDLLVGRRARLVTLTGPGGVGKSRLAIETARALAADFPGGVFFVPLESIDDPSLVPAALTRALRLTVTAGEDEIAAIRDFFGGDRALLFLDNFEQLLDAAQVVADLLSASPGLAVLVTSRAALRLRGEHEFAVEPLASSDAVELFVDRARAAGGTFDDEDEAAAEICDRLDRLPLAIELAAARTKLLPPGELLRRLAEKLDLVGGDRRDLPERQRALRTTIAWSYDLLEQDEQELFARLAVFVGQFTLDAVEAVGGPEVDAVAGLSSLIDNSLVQPATQGREPAFTILETIQRFAIDVLEESEHAEEVRRAHARFFVGYALDAHEGLRDARQAEWQARLEADAGNLNAALRWWLEHEDADTLADVVSSIWPFWWLAGRVAEGRELIEALLERRETMSPAAVGRAVAASGAVAFLQADFQRALADSADALERLRGLGLEADAAFCLGILGLTRVISTGGAAGEDEVRSAVRTHAAEGDHWSAVRLQNGLNWALQLAGRIPESEDECRSVVTAAEQLGSPQEVSMARANLGRYRVLSGDAAAGLPELLEGLELAAQMQHKGAIASILETVVEAAHALGATEQAVRLLAAAKAVREAIGVPPAPGQAARNERNEAALLAGLDKETFERASAEGSELPLEEVLAEARGLSSLVSQPAGR